MKRILLIEPDPITAASVVGYLQPGHKVVLARDGHEAIEVLDSQSFDIIITEHMFARHNSFEFLYELRSYPEWQSLPVLLFTKSYIPAEFLESDSWQNFGNIELLYKPVTSLAALASAINRTELKAA